MVGGFMTTLIRRRSTQEESVNFWPSFADLFVAFIFFWILVVIVSLITPAFSEGVIRRQILEQVSQTMNGSIPFSHKNIFSVNMETATIELKDTDIIFESGSADLSEKGETVVNALADGLRVAIEKHGKNINTIMIEGFADSNPIGSAIAKKYPSNWELSTARASSVLRHILTYINGNEEISKKFGAAGYGSSRATNMIVPIAEDRKIEIRILTEN